MEEGLLEERVREEKIRSKKLIADACLFAENAHLGQKRKNGEDYINHLRRGSSILYEWGASDIIISAYYLHDSVEDTEVTLDDIRKRFGERVALLVDGVTEVENDPAGQKTLQKIAQYSAKDLGVLLIKLADRIDNLESPASLEWKMQRYYKPTKEFLVPLAKSYGLGNIAERLENLLKQFE